jgi:low affinity Fe/Cu permease
METGGAGYEEDFEITFQTPQEAEETLNPIIKIEADKKKEILELLNQCDKVNNEKKEHIIHSINENKLKKLEVEEMISILNK